MSNTGKITARYVDTCHPEYLQDGYNRPGQTLCLASLGCTREETAEELLRSLDCDAGIPDMIDDSEIQAALNAALEGIDLRFIDPMGNRHDEPWDRGEYDDLPDDEPYIYVVLEWDATVLHLRMTVDVEYHLNGADPMELKMALEDMVRNAASNGDLTWDTDATVKSWGATAQPMEPAKWVSVPAGWQCSRCGETRREPYKEPHGC